MIEFAWPYVFLLIPLPWVLSYIIPRTRYLGAAALKVPDLNDFASFHLPSTLSKSNKHDFLFYVCFIAWALLVIAAARPQKVGEPIKIPQTGRDLMLAVDLSGSMTTSDFEINGRTVDRLTALKFILSDFIERRKGDRLGLILFGSQAYLQAPLTFDTTTIQQLLKESAVGLAGTETAIGDAIGLAVKQLKDNNQQSKVLILLTDGINNTGEFTPEKAASIAANAGLKIHTVAIGANEAIIQTIFGARRVHPSADIDEAALKMISEKTGGQYFRAYDTKELASIYQQIDQIEPIENDDKFFRPKEEIYKFPLLAALLLIAAISIVKVRK